MDTVLASQLGLDVAAIDAQLNENRGLPIHMYRDLPIFNFELDAIFHRSWQYLCPVEKLADPGSVVTDTLGKIPIVVTRAHDGQLHGLINSCRHRGYRVVEADAKECKVLRCRYHTWTYDLAGNLRRAPGTEDEPNFIRDELGLRRVAVDTWAQAVFVNPNPNAPPLREAFTRLDDWTDSFDFDPDPASYTLHREVVSDIEANWKLWWDNGTECYHCPSIHGSSFNSVYNTVGEDHRFETDRNMLSATFVTKRRETGELSSGKYRSIHLMPGFQAVQQSDFMLLSKMTPTSPSSCRFTVHYLAEVGADPARVDQWIDIWHATYLEDAEAISIQQQNMNIPDAPPFRYVSEREGPSIHVLRQYWETCKEMLVDDADRCN